MEKKKNENGKSSMDNAKVLRYEKINLKFFFSALF